MNLPIKYLLHENNSKNDNFYVLYQYCCLLATIGIYTRKPKFRGNPLNYNGLLAAANAQNKFDDTKKSQTNSLLDSFLKQ